MELQKVAPADLVACASNPRRRFDAAELNELAASIEKVGVLEPLVARLRPDGKLEIVAGERRWRAAKLAGVAEIPVVVKTLSEAEATEAMLIENLQRADLTPIEEARAFAAWCKAAAPAAGARPNLPALLAVKIGKGEDYVRERLKLLKLSGAAQEAVEAATLPLKAARLLTRIDDPDEQARVLEMARNGTLTPETLQYAQIAGLVDLYEAPWDLKAMTPACEGCPARAFRGGSVLLPALEAGRGKGDLGVCTKLACFLEKEQRYWGEQGAQVVAKCPKGCIVVDAWKKGCPGCEKKLLLRVEKRGAQLRPLCAAGYRHYDAKPAATKAEKERRNAKAAKEAAKEQAEKKKFEALREKYIAALTPRYAGEGALKEVAAELFLGVLGAARAALEALGMPAQSDRVGPWLRTLKRAELAKALATFFALERFPGPWRLAELARATKKKG